MMMILGIRMRTRARTIVRIRMRKKRN